jgi:hypothetical protein
VSSWARWCEWRARRWMRSVNTTRVVDELDRIAAQGNGAMRQLRAWRKRGEVMDVIAEAGAATLS